MTFTVFDLTADEVEELRGAINALPGLPEPPFDLQLCGSRVWGRPRPNSDLDVVVQSPECSKWKDLRLIGVITFKGIRASVVVQPPSVLWHDRYDLTTVDVSTGLVYLGDHVHERYHYERRELMRAFRGVNVPYRTANLDSLESFQASLQGHCRPVSPDFLRRCIAVNGDLFIPALARNVPTLPDI